MTWRVALAAILFAALAACTAVPPVSRERVVLLPSEDGRPTAVIVTLRDGRSLQLDQPYAAAQVSTTGLVREQASQEELSGRYALLLSVQPPTVRSFTLYFQSDQTALTAESERELDRVLREAAAVPAAEIEIIGHTDSRGSSEYNENLGRARAAYVSNIMISRGFSRFRLSVQTRGEREPLVLVPDGTNEPRNRRVEIRLR